MKRLDCFKAYDIRGRVPEELNEKIATGIGRAFCQQFKARKVVIGRDVRHSSQTLSDALAEGLMAAGADVLDLGLCGTEEIYHAAFSLDVDGGIVVTASHNPMDFNGMKLVRRGALPISGDTGLLDLHDAVVKGDFTDANQRGSYTQLSHRNDYVDHLLGYIEHDKLKPLKIVVNSGNGCAGPVLDALEPHLPFNLVKIQHEPDGSFPNGIPNPILLENQTATRDAVIAHGADLGIAWDGDFDRCFLFDENGCFVEGYYVVGLLAESFLTRVPGARIIHDPRLIWNTIDLVEANGGVAIQSKTGHAFIKERMRKEDAVYGGEMSAHHYFRDFAYCDSGMIPWLLVAALISRSGRSLSDLVGARMAKFPVSGEINRQVYNPSALIESVLTKYGPDALSIDETDGISVEFEQWRFSLRMSNTEPLVRLNVESKADVLLMQEKTAELLKMIDAV
jgi:phosphomannomutase